MLVGWAYILCLGNTIRQLDRRSAATLCATCTHEAFKLIHLTVIAIGNVFVHGSFVNATAAVLDLDLAAVLDPAAVDRNELCESHRRLDGHSRAHAKA